MIIYLLIAHVLGDFYFQSDKLAQAKKKEINALYAHSFIYSFVMLVFGVKNDFIVVSMLMGLVHFLIDGMFFYLRNNRFDLAPLTKVRKAYLQLIYNESDTAHIRTIANDERNLYFLDQGLHLVSIVFASKIFSNPEQINLGPMAVSVLSFLLIYKPASLTIRLLTQKYQVRDLKDVSIVPGAGALIGYMERTIMLLTLISRDSGLITFGFGFILTAKTISRYGKTRDDENFAQYFVIGTMMSILATLIAFFLSINFIYLF